MKRKRQGEGTWNDSAHSSPGEEGLRQLFVGDVDHRFGHGFYRSLIYKMNHKKCCEMCFPVDEFPIDDIPERSRRSEDGQIAQGNSNPTQAREQISGKGK